MHRYLLDRVSTRILALDGSGGAAFYADYAQWEMERAADAAAIGGKRAGAVLRAVSPGGGRGGAAAKLGYLEKREWEQMETRILEAEALGGAPPRRRFRPGGRRSALRPLGRARGQAQGLTPARLKGGLQAG